MKPKQLSKNLKLISVQENNFKGAELLAVACYFTFFNEDGIAYISINKIGGEYPSYAMIEITSELSDSFNELLEDFSIWKSIVAEIKEFIKEWEVENTED